MTLLTGNSNGGAGPSPGSVYGDDAAALDDPLVDGEVPRIVHLDDEVNAVAAGQLQDAIRGIFGAVVDGVLGAGTAGDFSLGVAADGANYVGRAADARHLQRHVAHRAGSARHQHRLARHRAVGKHAAVGRQCRHAQTGGKGEIHVFRAWRSPGWEGCTVYSAAVPKARPICD